MKYLLLVALVLTPFVSSAATFHYVNNLGITASVEAPNAETALMIAPNIKSNSGVALDEGYIESGTPVTSSVLNAFGYSAPGSGQSGFLYHFVNALGVTDSVQAPDAATALLTAPNIASNSGVAVDEGYIESGMKVLSAE